MDWEKNKERLYRWSPIILTILFYYFGVIKQNENNRVGIIYLNKNLEILQLKIDKLEDKKVDKESFNMLLNSMIRIENKLDQIKNVN